MKIHELKEDPCLFPALFAGKRTAEVRLNDRDYREGDYIRIQKGDLIIRARITHVMPLEYIPGLEESPAKDYVLLSFQLVNTRAF